MDSHTATATLPRKQLDLGAPASIETPSVSPASSASILPPLPPSSTSSPTLANSPAEPASVTAAHPHVSPRDSEALPRRPPPQPLLTPGTNTTRGRTGRSKSQLMADIPSTADFYAPAGPSSASPSSWSIASSDTGPSSASSVIESKIRFERLANGSHRHHLSAPKRQQFLSNQVRRLRELLDGKRERDDPSHNHLHAQAQLKPEVFQHPLSLLNEKYQDLDTEQSGSPVSTSRRRQHNVKTDFVQKYGELQQVIGKGAFGTVRMSIKRHPETLEEHFFAVKEFKYAHGESQKLYMRRLTSEFCIASSLKHTNIIQTLDLLQLHGDTYSEVMEYCAGGDLHSLIASAGTLGESESNCFFSQLINGVAFLHSMGVVHRDLKPENLLLTSDGCLKIADFGNSEVFRMPWEKKVRASASIRGTGPFIAPEEFTENTFDARKVDMWACGVIYMCMRLGRYTWHEASDGDPIWDGFMYKRTKFLEANESSHDVSPTAAATAVSSLSLSSSSAAIPTGALEHEHIHINLTALEQVSHITLSWPKHISDVVEHLLEPDSSKRWQAIRVLDSPWLQHADNCHPTSRPAEPILDESDFEPTATAALSQRVGSKVVPEDTTVTGCGIVKEVQNRRGTSTTTTITTITPTSPAVVVAAASVTVQATAQTTATGTARDNDAIVAPVS
ncbi:serine/threonine-protein kinase HAL4/sat4 [Mortierella alpina]|nr:serine/threonine-protein kinase HAL4/sat4 [Mortierella alpina]